MLATLLAEVRALRTQVAELGQVRNQEEGSKLSFDFSKIQKQDVMIRFNFKRIHKKEVYQAFLNCIMGTVLLIYRKNRPLYT